ncbi:hypothetical protein DRQ20_05180 [bacterium]|nr:MAG: hypothetical protein DRQ20_05180 [bacterium]
MRKVMILFFALLLLGVGEKSFIRLEYLEEKELTRDMYIKIALAEGRRIVKIRELGGINQELLFISKDGRVIRKIEGKMRYSDFVISEDGRYAGVLYTSEEPVIYALRDSFVVYDSTGRKLYSIKRGDAGSDTVLTHNILQGLSPSERLKIKGERLVVIENHNKSRGSYKGYFHILFFNKGRLIRRVKIPRRYLLQAAWSPDGEMFVISCSGHTIYVFDKEGNKLWERVLEGVHLMPPIDYSFKTLAITQDKIIHFGTKGLTILDRDGKHRIDLDSVEGGGPCYLIVSPDGNHCLGWFHSGGRVYLVSLRGKPRVVWWRDFKEVIHGAFSNDSRSVFLLIERKNGRYYLAGFKVENGNLLGVVPLTLREKIWSERVGVGANRIYVYNKYCGTGKVYTIRITRKER